MAVQFILGGTGCGKTSYVFDEMLKRSHENNSIELYIVPEQYTLQAQEEFIAKSDTRGLLNIEVLSFNRLVYRFFDELGLVNKKAMDDNGKSLIIRRIIDTHYDEFIWIKKHRKKQSYMDELNSLITECYQYSITEELLNQYIKQVEEQLLKDKLTDLKVLFGYFKQEMAADYLTSHEAAMLLIQKLPSIKMLQNATITIDSFYGFTPLQYQFIESLLNVAKDMYICLTIPVQENLTDLRNEGELFFESKKAISHLRDIFQGCSVKESDPIMFEDYKRSESTQLRHLSNQLYRYPLSRCIEEGSAIRFMEAMSIDDEVEAVALRIHKLIAESEYRFKDIVVLTSTLSSYEIKINQLFKEYHLVHFIDKKDNIMEHPLVQFVLSSLLVVQFNFQYEHVFYHLKSIFYKNQTDINLIENRCLKYGVKGLKKWQADWDEYEELKANIITPLMGFCKAIKEAKTIKGKTIAIYEYIQELLVYESLTETAEDYEQKNQLQDANKLIKVYELVLDMFDELVELVGDETVSIKDFVGIIETGLTGIKLGQTPPSVDQILVGDISRTRFKENKIVFILGINEGKVPLVRNTNQLLTDHERTILLSLGLEVAPNQSQSLFKEQMNIYMAFTKATKLLHVSYTRRDEEGSSRPAPLFLMLKKLFPLINVENAITIIQGEKAVTRSLPMFRRLAMLASKNDFNHYERDIEKLYNFFKKAYNNSETFSLNPDIIKRGLSYTNKPSHLDRLKTKNYKLSVSELETYASCPYAHYLDYQLKVKERSEYVITMPDIGILFHKCLELYIRKCVHREQDISSISVELRNSLIEECVDEVLLDEHNKIFSSSYRNKYLVVKLTRILKRALWGIEQQLSKSLFKPKEIEYKFDGSENQLESLILKIAPDVSMFLKGVVDRVDEYETEDALHISIIDYKSSKKTLDFGLIDSGIQLQLFVYLNVVKEIKESGTSKKVIPSGLYYYQIQDPMIQNNDKDSSKIDDELLKQLRPNGLVLHDEEVVKMFDSSITGTSNVIPVTMTKNGISARSATITEEEMDVALDFVNNKSKQLGTKIYNGEVSIKPYKYDKSTHCDYCKFTSVCRFDPSNSHESYYEINKNSKENIIEKMKGERHGRSH